jgi:hypothetical protein
MPDYRFVTGSAKSQDTAAPGYVITLSDKEDLLADPRTCYYPPGY